MISAHGHEDQVEITVADTGVGISEADLPYVFEDFYRGREGQSGEKGQGLGLALSQRIIETHNGTIYVESELGKGSTFVIRLPGYDDTQSSPTTLVSGAVTNHKQGV